MLSKPAANKPAAADKTPPALLPSEILYAIEKLGDDAIIIEYNKMRDNNTKTTAFGGVFLNRLDPKKPAAPPVKTPLTIMMVSCPVFGGCRKKTEKDKSKAYSASFTTRSVFSYNGKEERYGEARIRVAEIFTKKMEALLAAKLVEPYGKAKVTTGVQMDVEDENDRPTGGRKAKRVPLDRDDYIIRVEIPFKKEKGSQNFVPNAEPECIIRDIAQSRKGEDGRRKYSQPVMVTVEGARTPLVYSNMPNFLLGGSEITGVEICDSWSNSEMALALSHKFKEIIVKRGSGTRVTSLVGAIDESYFDKMAEGANTDETIEQAQRDEALKAAESGEVPAAVSTQNSIPSEDLPPADPENTANENGEDDFGDELDVESSAAKVPVLHVAPKVVAKPPATKPAPKLTTPAETKVRSPANKPAVTAAVPKTPVQKTNKKPAVTPPPPAPTLGDEDDFNPDETDF